MECMPCRFIPRYNAQTEEAEFLRGGEADVADNRLPEQELAELGQSHGSHSNGPSHSANAVHPHPRSSKTSLGVQHSISLNRCDGWQDHRQPDPVLTSIAGSLRRS